MLKSYLKEKNIAFEDIVLDYNPDKAAEAVHICKSMGVPCTHITKDDGTEISILGFDKERINEALGIQ